jgi:hypothetical protein
MRNLSIFVSLMHLLDNNGFCVFSIQQICNHEFDSISIKKIETVSRFMNICQKIKKWVI